MQGGIRRSTQFFDFLTPALRFVAPAQTVCNYATLLARNAQDLPEHRRRGRHRPAVHRHVGRTGDVLAGINAPNSENGPSSGPGQPATGFAGNNYLHANPYPNTASPGQTRECEAGNETYIPDQVVIGNVPGNQGTGRRAR